MYLADVGRFTIQLKKNVKISTESRKTETVSVT